MLPYKLYNQNLYTYACKDTVVPVKPWTILMIRHVDTQELEARDNFYFNLMSAALGLHVVHMSSLVFLSLKVRLLNKHHAARLWISFLVVWLIVVADVTYPCGISCIPDNDVGVIQWHTVMGEHGVDHINQHITLWESMRILEDIQ